MPFLLFRKPFNYTLGIYTVTIDWHTLIYLLLSVSIHLLILFLPVFFLFTRHNSSINNTDSNIINDSLYYIVFIYFGFFISILTVLSNVYQLPLKIEQVVKNLSVISLFFISYGVYLIFTTSVNKLLLKIMIIFNLIAFLVIPIFLGYLNKIIPITMLLLFVLIIIRLKLNMIYLFLITIFIIFSCAILQKNKSFIRMYLYNGAYNKITTKENISHEKTEWRCNISQTLIPTTFTKKGVSSATNVLDQFEVGYNSKYGIQSLNSNLLNNYSINDLKKGLDYFDEIIKYAELHENNLLIFGLARGWGNSIPRDGTRAARIFQYLYLNSSDIVIKNFSLALWGLLIIEGNGIKLSIKEGISCVLISEVDIIIRKLIIESSLTSTEYINNILEDKVILFFENNIKDQNKLKNIIKTELDNKKYYISNNNTTPSVHNIFFNWLKVIDNNNFLISSLIERVDQSRNLILILDNFYLKNNKSYLGYSYYKNIQWSLIPRFFFENKPIINDDIGIAIGDLLGITDVRQESVSWSMPLIIELILVDGFYSLFYFSFFLSLLTLLYFYFAKKNIQLFFLFASAYIYNISNCLFTGFAGVSSGLIQSFILCCLICLVINGINSIRKARLVN
jgi:hypothetical protein